MRTLTEFITAEIYFGCYGAEQDLTEAHFPQRDVIEIINRYGFGLHMQKYAI